MIWPDLLLTPLALPFWLVLAYALWREAPISRQAWRTRTASQDRGTASALALGSLASTGAALALAWQGQGALPQPHSLLAGTVLLALGTALRRHCVLTLGPYFSGTVRVARHQPVIQAGAYRWLRHPAYAGALLMMAGSGLSLGHGPGLALLLLVHVPLYLRRMATEEAALIQLAGNDYLAYRARTWRLVPGLY